MSDQTFMEKCRVGTAMSGEIDEFVQMWHESESRQSLHDFLGMTEQEYSLWLRDPNALPYIISAREPGQSFSVPGR